MKETDAKAREALKISIAKTIGDVRRTLYITGMKTIPKAELTAHGYIVSYETGRNGYGRNIAMKDGIKVPICFYGGSCTYDADYGFYFGEEQYCSFTDIDSRFDELTAAGIVATYQRPQQMQDFIDSIREKIEETAGMVRGRGLGEIGGFMRSKGYFVSYDGSGWCTFSKDGIRYDASSDINGWRLKDRIRLYIIDDILTTDFAYNTDARLDGLSYLELFIGGETVLGREMTEMDRLHKYTKFRVRTYSNRYLDTVEWFNDFEEAKQHAYDLAVEKAKSVNPRYREWAITKPKDRGKEFDMLACFVWYECNNSKHLVFVQGEN